MTHVFGPDTTLEEVGLSERLASWLFAAWFPLANRALADQEWRFDREKLRLSVRGESEHSGDAFTRGRVVDTLWHLNMWLLLFPLGLVAAVARPIGGVMAVVAAAGVMLLGIGACFIAFGSVDLARETQVVDHTTEPTPDAISDLQTQYVDGEIETATFEQRVEEVIDR